MTLWNEVYDGSHRDFDAAAAAHAAGNFPGDYSRKYLFWLISTLQDQNDVLLARLGRRTGASLQTERDRNLEEVLVEEALVELDLEVKALNLEEVTEVAVVDEEVPEEVVEVEDLD